MGPEIKQNPNTLYEIRIDGKLSARWMDWFDGFHIHTEENGETTLTGHIVDQSALYGVLAKLGHLNIRLLSVRQVGGESNS